MKNKKKKNEAQARYDKKNTKGFYIKLNIRTDADIIEELNTKENKQGYIKMLIRADRHTRKIKSINKNK